MVPSKSLHEAHFRPIKVVEVELSNPIPDIYAGRADSGMPYAAAEIIVRLHTLPLAMVNLPLEQDHTPADVVSAAIWREARDLILGHLGEDGLPLIETLPREGLSYSETPACIRSRAQINESAPMVSVVVCTHDRLDLIRATFPALLQLDYPNYEVVLVDNAPRSTELKDYLESQFGTDRRLRYVREDRGGLSWARNAGIRYACGEIIAFTDDDAIVDPHWLTELVLGYGEADRVACVTGLVLPQEIEAEVQYWFEQFGGLSAGFEPNIYDLGEHKPHNPIFPYSVALYGGGVNMSFKADILRELGGFDVVMATAGAPFGAEDITTFVKVIEAGYQIVYRPRALVRHIHRRDYAGLRRQIYRYGVGLTAFLTHCAVRDPLWIFRVATKIPAAVNHIFSAKSSKNDRKSVDYPPELNFLERRGMIYGPLAYVQTRWRLRGARNEVEPIKG